MGGFMKSGRVCILTSGRFAGKKGIIVSQHDSRANREFPHALIAGIERYPKRVTRRMGKKRIARKSSNIKPFLKPVNLTHLLPTRYVVKDFDFEGITDAVLKEKETKQDANKTLRKVFEKKYLQPTGEDKSENTKFFFKKLRF